MFSVTSIFIKEEGSVHLPWVLVQRGRDGSPVLILQDPLGGFCIGKREQPWNAPGSNKMNEHMGGDANAHFPMEQGNSANLPLSCRMLE